MDARSHSDKPILFGFYRGVTWRVRLALAFKEIEYEYRGIDCFNNLQNTNEYLARNPSGQVPTMFIDGVYIPQTMAIIEYLDETRPGKKLLPSDPIRRAHVRAMTQIINCNIAPLQTKPVVERIISITGDEDKGLAWAQYYISRFLRGLEMELSRKSGLYSFGDKFTIADCFLVPQVHNARRYNVDMSQFPNINRVFKNVYKLDFVEKTAPEYQPDCPANLRKN